MERERVYYLGIMYSKSKYIFSIQSGLKSII